MLNVMRVLTWVAFIGLMVEAGAILLSFCVTCFNPEAAHNLYNGLDMYDVRQGNFGDYLVSVLLLAAVPAIKALMCYLLIKILTKVNLTSPFTLEIARAIERVSYMLIGTWFVSVLRVAHGYWLAHITDAPPSVDLLSGYLFVAGLVFVISQIFKRGVEMQSENELTV